MNEDGHAGARREGGSADVIAVPAGAPDPTGRTRPGRGGPGGHSGWRGWSQLCARWLAVLVVLGGTLIGVGVSGGSAQAVDFECAVGASEAANRGPELPGGGVTALIPVAREDLRPGDVSQYPESDYTLWEVMGPRGLRWSYTPQALGDDWNPGSPEDGIEEECSLMDAAGTYVAQMIWEASRFVGGYTIFVKQYASAEAPFESLYGARDSLVNTLRDGLFVPAIVIALMVTGFWVATRLSRRQNSRDTYAGVITAAVLVVLVVAVLSGDNYARITGVVDKYTGQFNTAAMNTVLSDNAEQASPCYIPPRSLAEDGENENVQYNRGKRLSTCMLYQALLFNPWVNGQFGTSDVVNSPNLTFGDEDYCRKVDDNPEANSRWRCTPGDRPQNDEEKKKVPINLGAQQVIAQGFTSNDMNRVDPGDQGEQSAVVQRHRSLWEGVQYATARDHEPKYDIWRGAEPTGRMATAVSSIVVNLIALIFVGAIGVLTIFWHGVLFIGWILLPITGAFAVYPPARRLLRAHVGVMVQAVFLRNIFGLLLAVLLGILNALQINEGNTALKIFLMIIAAVALWKVLSAIRSGALSPHVDETEGTSTRTTVSDTRPMRMVSGAGAGAVTGAAAARRAAPAQGGAVARYVDMAGGAARGAGRGATTGAQGGTVGQTVKSAAAAGSGGNRSRRFFGRGEGQNDQSDQNDQGVPGGGAGGRSDRNVPAGRDGGGSRGAAPRGATGRRVEVDPPADAPPSRGGEERGRPSGPPPSRGAEERSRPPDRQPRTNRSGDQGGAPSTRPSPSERPPRTPYHDE